MTDGFCIYPCTYSGGYVITHLLPSAQLHATNVSLGHCQSLRVQNWVPAHLQRAMVVSARAP